MANPLFITGVCNDQTKDVRRVKLETLFLWKSVHDTLVSRTQKAFSTKNHSFSSRNTTHSFVTHVMPYQLAKTMIYDLFNRVQEEL